MFASTRAEPSCAPAGTHHFESETPMLAMVLMESVSLAPPTARACVTKSPPSGFSLLKPDITAES